MRRRSTVVIVVSAILLVVATATYAQSPRATHVRTDSPALRDLIDELYRRSPSGRALIDALDASDVVVYVQCRMFWDTDLRGRIGMVDAKSPTRLLIVEIGAGRPVGDQLVYLAHELQHAVEIAGAPDVVNAQTLSALYRRIGDRTHLSTVETFETAKAREMGERVRRELGEAARWVADEEQR